MSSSWTSLLLLAALAAPAGAQHAAPQSRPVYGDWEAPFQHDMTGFASSQRFEVVHAAVIPVGPNRGKVIVWDLRGPQHVPAWVQRWSIVDVSGAAPVFSNGELTLPVNAGDLFCAGHAWNARGELVVAGGTARYFDEARHGGLLGGKLLYTYDPVAGPGGTWRREADLSVDRWYPTVVQLSSGGMLIASGTPGGTHPAWNDYEVLGAPDEGSRPRVRNAPARTRHPGPAAPAAAFELYPRIFQLASGEQFVSGMTGPAARTDHAAGPGAWTPMGSSSVEERFNSCALLYPVPAGAPQLVMEIGGELVDDTGAQRVLDTVEVCEPSAAGAPGWSWTTWPRLREARSRANAVILPDRSVVVIGGRGENAASGEWLANPELFDGERWHVQPEAASPRGYHSVAVLLPDARVLTAGGDSATWEYQVFVPPYLRAKGARPRITAAPAVLGYASSATLDHAPLPPTESVGHVALVAPGSVTHSHDASQRYVELELGAASATSVEIEGPPDAHHAPPGHYMLFLVSAAGVPSVAEWVEVR